MYDMAEIFEESNHIKKIWRMANAPCATVTDFSMKMKP